MSEGRSDTVSDDDVVESFISHTEVPVMVVHATAPLMIVHATAPLMLVHDTCDISGDL